MLVAAPGSDGSVVNGVTAALRQAGATVTGEIALEPAVPGHRRPQRGRAHTTGPEPCDQGRRDAPGRCVGPCLRPAGCCQSARREPAGPERHRGCRPRTAAPSLTNCNQASYLSIANRRHDLRASLAGCPDAPGGAPPQAGSQVLVALAVALSNAGDGAVMVGGSGSVGPNSVLNAETTARPGVDGRQCRYRDRADHGGAGAVRWLPVTRRPASYGIGPGAAPSPAPTPSVTPTVTPSTHASSGGHK